MIYKFTECRQNRRMFSTEKCFPHNRRIRIILLNEMRDFQRIVIFVVLNRLQSIKGKIQSQGCQAGSILQRLSGLQAAATNRPTLLSVPSNWERLVSLAVMAVTALPTRSMITSPSFVSTCCCPLASTVILEVGSTFFLFQAIISSLSTALSRAWILKLGCERHLAAAIIDAVRGPATPTEVTSSVRFGVRRNRTGRFDSSSPDSSSRSNLK